MRKYWNKHLITSIITLLLVALGAQVSAMQHSATTDTLALPFFDDFARLQPAPRTDRWEQGGGVRTNLRYALNTKSIGTATFDAAAANGSLYPNLSTSPLPADTLTSLPINLERKIADSLYLSFFVQPQGLGYTPSERDSLVVELLDSTQQWHRAVAITYQAANQTLTQHFHIKPRTIERTRPNITQQFHPVMLPIDDSLFLYKGFRFRLINYASIDKQQTIASRQGNCDHWSVDLIRLDAHRHQHDTTLNDIAFCAPIEPMLNGYTSVPWHAFGKASKDLVPRPMQFTTQYANLGDSVWNVTRYYKIIDLSGQAPTQSFSGGSANSEPFTIDTFTRNFEYDHNFTSAWADSGKFRFVAYLSTNNNPKTAHLRHNDTLYTDLLLHNYYAYDDGSAETGWGFIGEGTNRAQAAMRFTSLVDDTLKGIMIYFNHTLDDANATSFKLTLWNERNNQPGDIIAQRAGVRTAYADSLNRFICYQMPATFIAKGSNFYIGWQQVYEVFMHVGVDLNTNHSSKLLYNKGNGWTPVSWDGTLMIRPIMGSTAAHFTAAPTRQRTSINLYPNPANSIVNIGIPDDTAAKSVAIYHSCGTLSLQQTYAPQIDVAHLPNGLYIVRVALTNGQMATGKLIISR